MADLSGKMNLLVLNSRVDADHPTQSVTTRWLNNLSPLFGRIFVITVHRGRLALKDNIAVYPLASPSRDSRVRRLARLYSLTMRILRSGEIGGVFVHQAVMPGALIGPLIKALRIPMLVWYSHREVNPWLRAAHFWADGVISSSRDSFRMRSGKFEVTGHGIDTDAFCPGPARGGKGSLKIGYAGRFAPVKRIEVLLEAASMLIARGKDNFAVDLYGFCQNRQEEQYFRRLKEIVRRRNLVDAVTFHGTVSNWDMPSLLQKFDLFVSQQETGGTDKAVLEAMSCGLPVIMATRTFDMDLSPEMRSSLVFPSGGPGEMTEKIAAMIDLDPDSRRAMGAALRDLVLNRHSLRSLSLKIRRILEAMSAKGDWKTTALENQVK